MKLFEQMIESGIKPNSFVLNTLTLLHCNALRPDDLEANILPLYEKHRIKHDVYTYQNLSKLYLNLREFDTVKKLYRSMKTEGLQPNKQIANTVLEAAMRTDDSDIVYDALQDFVAMKHEPHRRLKGTLANMKSLPDRIYIIMKEHFGGEHPALQRARAFELPTFGGGKPQGAAMTLNKGWKGKKYKPKKASKNKLLTYKERKTMNIL